MKCSHRPSANNKISKMSIERHFVFGDEITLTIAGQELVGSADGSACSIVARDRRPELAVFRLCSLSDAARDSAGGIDFARSNDSFASDNSSSRSSEPETSSSTRYVVVRACAAACSVLIGRAHISHVDAARLRLVELSRFAKVLRGSVVRSSHSNRALAALGVSVAACSDRSLLASE